jgi:hypothetical protein
MAKQIELVIEPDGHTRHLVDPLSEKIGAAVGPKVKTWRSSNVETWSSLSQEARDWFCGSRNWDPNILDKFDRNHFWADMLPVGGPVLGPFPRHNQAIQAEIKWLQQNNLPMPVFRLRR